MRSFILMVLLFIGVTSHANVPFLQEEEVRERLKARAVIQVHIGAIKPLLLDSGTNKSCKDNEAIFGKSSQAFIVQKEIEDSLEAFLYATTGELKQLINCRKL